MAKDKSKKSNKNKIRKQSDDDKETRTSPPLSNAGDPEEPTINAGDAPAPAVVGCDKELKNKKRRKVKKDKWGQPIVDLKSNDGEQELEDEMVKETPSSGAGGELDAVGSVDLYEGNKVVVSGMPYWTTEEEIRQLFEGIGDIVLLQLSKFPDTGNFRGLAFVSFESEEAATNSLNLNGTMMGNRVIKVERCRLDSQRKRKHDFLGEPQKSNGCLSAYIGNLSWDVTEDEIRDLFKESKVSSVRFAIDKNTGKFRGFCHVDFDDDESLEKVIRKNQVELHGRPMKISYAVSNRNS